MKTRTAYIIMAIGAFATAASTGNGWIMFVLPLLAISWQVHVLEMKVNKLLGAQGLHVTAEEENQ